jgi:hypothetical protein
MRPDNEVNVPSFDRTVGMAASVRPPKEEPEFEPTVVGMRRPAAPAPGYDPTQKKDGGDPAFAKTDVVRKPGGPSGTGGA